MKNFYYNRSGIVKLIYMYNFLSPISFLNELSVKVKNCDFSKSETETDLLIKIYDKMNPSVIFVETLFGKINIYQSKAIFYFKEDFDYDEFIRYFFFFETDQKITWKYVEFFDKTIKIIEILRKNSLMRNFREEVFFEGKKKSIKKISLSKINTSEKNFLSFIKNYKFENIKLVVHFSVLTL